MNPKAIVCKDLTKKFGDFKAVDHISFDVGQGEIFGFLGANGAGYDVFRQQEKIKASIGYMSQKFSLYENLTVFENIQFYGGVYGLSRSEIKQRGEEMVSTLGLK